jgi:hypothetical protein
MINLEKKLQASLIPNKLQKEVLEYVTGLEAEVKRLNDIIDKALEILQL